MKIKLLNRYIRLEILGSILILGLLGCVFLVQAGRHGWAESVFELIAGVSLLVLALVLGRSVFGKQP